MTPAPTATPEQSVDVGQGPGRALYIGVDVGLKGAIAVLSEGGDPLLYPLLIPMFTLKDGKGRESYNIQALIAAFEFWKDNPLVGLLAVEKQQVLPPGMGGGSANYARGRGLAIFETISAALRVPYEIVAPKTWQRIYHRDIGGDDLKAKSVIAAQRLFPGVDLKRTARCRKQDDGIAEALLLAHYARARCQGGAEAGG